MSPRIAINGLGRMGKLLLRDLIDTGAGGEIVLVNEPFGDLDQLALLMEFDTVHGRWDTDISAADGVLSINGQGMRFTQETSIEACRWPRLVSIWSSTAPASSRPRPR